MDDNEFNILPIKHLIKEQFDLDIDQASNGSIACSMFMEGFEKSCRCKFRTYRLIIMDLQMPVMDGKEASNIIIAKINGDKIRR